MALRFSMILEAIDRVTGPARRIRAANSQIGQGVRRMAQDMRKARRDVESGARSLEHFQRRAQRLRRVALGRMFQATANSARQLGRNLRDIPRRLRLIERAGSAAGRSLRWMGSMGLGAASWLGGKALDLAKWGLAAGAAAGSFAIYDMFRDASKAEQAQVQLADFLGSAEEAQSQLRALRGLNLGVPIVELMEAYVELRKAGIDPSTDSLRILADEARHSRLPFQELVEAISEARRGDFGGLDRLGIDANTHKNIVSLTFLDKTGRRVTRQVVNNAELMEDALLKIFGERSQGSVERYQRTFDGLVASMRNRWNEWQLMVADAGIYDRVKSKLEEWHQRITRMSEDGRLARWAEQVSNWLERAFDWGVRFVEDTDWNSVAVGMMAIVNALTQIFSWIGRVYTSWMRFRADIEANNAERTEKGFFGSDAERAAARARRQHLESIYGPLTESGRSESRNSVGNSDHHWKRPLNFGRIMSGGRSMLEPQQVEVGGKAQVEISLAPELRSRVRGMTSANPLVPFELQTGRTMRAGS